MQNRILQLRQQYNLSQRALAIKIETSQKSIDNWEKGITEPTACVLVRMADLFGCSIDYILGREDELGNIPSYPVDFDKESETLLSYYRKCDETHKKSLLSYARFLCADK